MHQFGWLSERVGNFLNLFQKEERGEGGTGGAPSEKVGPTLEKTMPFKYFRRTLTFFRTGINSSHRLMV